MSRWEVLFLNRLGFTVVTVPTLWDLKLLSFFLNPFFPDCVFCTVDLSRKRPVDHSESGEGPREPSRFIS